MVISNPLDRKAAGAEISAALRKGYPYYVYGLVDGISGDLFYIGKGTSHRLFDHARLSNKSNEFKNLIIKENGCDYFIFGFYTTSELAFSYEIAAIAHVGVNNLTNMAPGGLGQDSKFASEFAKQQWAAQFSKIREATQTAEYKRLMSEISKKRWQDPDYAQRRLAAMNTPEYKEKARKATIERMKDPEQRYKAGNGKRGVKQRQEVIDKRAKTMRSVWADPEYKERLRKKLSDATSSPEGRKQKFAAMMRHRVEKKGPPKSGYYGVEECPRRSGNTVYSPASVVSGKRKRLGTFDDPADAYKVFYEHHLANGYDVSMLPNPEKI